MSLTDAEKANNINSNAEAIFRQVQIIEQQSEETGIARTMFGLSYVESVPWWYLPMSELLVLKGRDGDTGPWQMLPIYMLDAHVWWANRQWRDFIDREPKMDTLESQSWGPACYWMMYRKSKCNFDMSKFWLLHHYGPGMKNRAGNMEETNQYEANYKKGLEVYDHVYDQVQGK